MVPEAQQAPEEPHVTQESTALVPATEKRATQAETTDKKKKRRVENDDDLSDEDFSGFFRDLAAREERQKEKEQKTRKQAQDDFPTEALAPYKRAREERAQQLPLVDASAGRAERRTRSRSPRAPRATEPDEQEQITESFLTILDEIPVGHEGAKDFAAGSSSRRSGLH